MKINKFAIKLFNILFSVAIWLAMLFVLNLLHLLDNADKTVLVAASLGAFFFSLTTSPVTWTIKSLGIEIGSNSPDHFQVDKTIKEANGRETILIVRDYGHSHSSQKINEILNEQTKEGNE